MSLRRVDYFSSSDALDPLNHTDKLAITVLQNVSQVGVWAE